MNNALEAMLVRYQVKNNSERENAIKEIMQEIALAGLSRAGFFKKAAFYGGTCLRIFHGLDRFSENLDFALLEKDDAFQLSDYLPALKKEFLSYGIDVDIAKKKKSTETAVQSAFVKGNTLFLMMSFFPESADAKTVISNQKIKIKFEIDTENPSGGNTEIRYRLLPAPYEVQIFDEPTLFAGKIHALLCREYAQHVKGRDFYDYLFYVAKGTHVNLKYLENKLIHSGRIDQNTVLDLYGLKEMLRQRFETVDYRSAKEDVSSFITDPRQIDLWGTPLFVSTLDELKAS